MTPEKVAKSKRLITKLAHEEILDYEVAVLLRIHRQNNSVRAPHCICDDRLSTISARNCFFDKRAKHLPERLPQPEDEWLYC